MKKNIYVIIISFLFSVILWISISLSNDFYATFEVPVKLIDFPYGYSTGSALPREISVKLKGKGWKLISINLGAESDFVIPVGFETGRRYMNLYNYISENPWLSSDVEVVSISPDTLSFFIEKAFAKKLKIVPDLNLGFKQGYGLASKVIISPDSTIVYGPYSYLKNLDSIKTKLLSLENLDSKTSERIGLGKISGMRYRENNVSVTLDVQKIVDKSFDNLFVKIIDAPKDREVVLLPNRIKIGLRGGVDVLGKVDTSQFTVYVNYRDIVTDTLGGVVPHVISPENTSLIFTDPGRLRYVIKKFN
ncbi:MAG: CdaR family protein [Ignavibacteriaceae bacterium]